MTEKEELRPHLRRYWKRVSRTHTCWNWNGTVNPSGYGMMMVKRRFIRVHRLAWEITHGKVPHGLCVLHRCDNKLCVNPLHLFLGTRIDNNRDRDLKGRTVVVHGPKNGNTKLKEHQVLDIKILIKHQGRSFASLGRQFNVRWQTIQAIAKGRTWKHI